MHQDKDLGVEFSGYGFFGSQVLKEIMAMMNIEDTKIVLQTLKLDFSRTEREAIEAAIHYLELLEDYLEDKDD